MAKMTMWARAVYLEPFNYLHLPTNSITNETRMTFQEIQRQVRNLQNNKMECFATVTLDFEDDPSN